MGPTLPISEKLHREKYRGSNETFRDAMGRIAGALKDSDAHFHAFRDILLDMRFLPGGRVQAAIGAARATTAYNCYVSGTIPDSMQGIMTRLSEAAETMRMGGGIGYDFSTLRPRGDNIASLESTASGPVSFMDIYDALCGTVCSAGHRRGAQMGVMRVDHPDIEEFVSAKHATHKLTNFNVSVGVTDEFMAALEADAPFDLVYEGKRYKTIEPRLLWDKIMRSTWDYAEPGVLFLDTINRENNLWYCETIAATNPCGEQPLPPFGACLLGSLNLTKYVVEDASSTSPNKRRIDVIQILEDMPHIIRAMDNVIDRTRYPLPSQAAEAYSKRRMGIGLTGAANAIEALGHPYGSPMFRETLRQIMGLVATSAYGASVELAKEKGPFPLFNRDAYPHGAFIQRLPKALQEAIAEHGIRNSHLLSIAPTGTISLTADNVSSGIEPVFAHKSTRTIQTPDGPTSETFKDYGLARWGVAGKTSALCTVDDHVNVLLDATYWVDSAVSKTLNVGDDVTWEQFKEIYLRAFKGGAKGCTTFRAAGKRQGIMQAIDEPVAGSACTFDPETGAKSCDA